MQPATPVLQVLAQPRHLFFVPGEYLAMEAMVALLISILVPLALGHLDARPEIGIAVFAPLHLYGAWRFRRDPYFVQVWLAGVRGPGRAAANRNRHLVKRQRFSQNRFA